MRQVRQKANGAVMVQVSRKNHCSEATFSARLISIYSLLPVIPAAKSRNILRLNDRNSVDR